jgi:glycosyltransferase involved in cell wall biosynthesis
MDDGFPQSNDPPLLIRRNAQTSVVEGGNISFDYRPKVKGKFIYIGEEKFWVRGVTYGTFRPGHKGYHYPNPEVVERDFAAIAENGMNVVRTYTVPPRWLLDTAQKYGLRIMVGLPWEQHIAFLEDRQRAKAIATRVHQEIKRCAGHPAVLCYSVGNEIPASIVRWHGRQWIERFIESLYRIAKSVDPESLVTYVNFPTTEYLQLPFLDLVCFNVFLEHRDRLEAYLCRLQNIAGERPLMMAEIGLDSRRNGEEEQARSIDWQVRAAFSAGCAGAFVFAWTDDWHRGGYDIEDWDFGLTTRERHPKPALAAVSQAFAEIPFPPETKWPRISVVVCTYNGARTFRETMEGLKELDYPDYEVIVVDDGSTDHTIEIAREYEVNLISTINNGLSYARNVGWKAATGEIVAYIDDDAYPDPHWLKYLASTFLTTSFVGVGGPNLLPWGDGPVAECVANAPGGPVHVLVSDREAEHIPGCNMAFRRTALEAIGGFDPRFRTAGDDVDVCWSIQQQGWNIGYNPAAVVWHHRRNSIKAYWKQQQGYGKAEALLERKWPEKYNAKGHLTWAGRIYGNGNTKPIFGGRWRIYQGVWGTAPFQPLHQDVPGTFHLLPLMPEWYLVIAFLAVLSSFGVFWKPLLLSLPILAAVVASPVILAVLGAKRARFQTNSGTAFKRMQMRVLTGFLYLMQPLARLIGRMRHGLTPWRHRGIDRFLLPWKRIFTIWSETWRDKREWLRCVEDAHREVNAPVLRGGEFDTWDLEVRGGIFGSVRTLMAVEEHGAGRQMVRFRAWPKFSPVGIALVYFFTILACWAGMGHSWQASALLDGIAFLLALRILQESAYATATLLHVLEREKSRIGNGS